MIPDSSVGRSNRLLICGSLVRVQLGEPDANKTQSLYYSHINCSWSNFGKNPRIYTHLLRPLSSVWLERLPVTQEVAGSSPVGVARKMKNKTEDGKEIKSFIQKMYKVGYGPNLWGIISEDSLDKYTYLEGAIEDYGERTIYYIEES